MEGFYKETEDGWLYAPNGVSTPDYDININDKDNYSYPIDGWYYLEQQPEGVTII